jgi:hypothetical protein
MFYSHVKYGRWGILSTLLLCLCLLAACSTSGPASNNPSPAATTSTVTKGTPSATPAQNQTAGNTRATATPIQSNGAAPIELGTPTPLPGGSSTSQQAVLKDRTLVIESVSKQKGTNPDPVAINLTLTIKNTGDRAIQNQASFFQLIGMDGDFFGQINSSDNFYGPIAAHTTRSGTINFQLPAAAATNLRLMYRSEVPSGALLIPLKLQ